MKISRLLSTISPLVLFLLFCPVTPTDVGQEKKQVEANDFRSITSKEDHSFFRRFLPERLVNLVFRDYEETYLRGSKSSVAAIDQGFLRGRHLDSVFHHCTPSLVDGHCVYKRPPTTGTVPPMPGTTMRHCEDDKVLGNGARLSVMLVTQPRFNTSDSIKIDGNTSIGVGADQGQTRDHHWTYVIDASPSTANTLCGIPGDPSSHILDCEKQAILGVHAEIEKSGSAIDYGLTSFSAFAVPAYFGLFLPVTTDRDAQEGDIEREVNLLTAVGDLTADLVGGKTNFADALTAAAVSITASSATYKHIIFLSDGQSNLGGYYFSSALTNLKNKGATIFSFAVGNASSCTGGSDGTLQEMANETGGTCTKVTNAADLGNELKNVITSKMMNDSLTVSGGSVEANHTKKPPFDGPGVDQLNYTEPASSRGTGIYEACISATGRGPADVPASDETARCCVAFEVKA